MTLSPPLSQVSLQGVNRHSSKLLSQFDGLFRDFLAKGGPMPAEYSLLNRSIRHLADSVRSGAIRQEELSAYIQDTTQQHLSGTMQATALRKRHGYSGDFEIIDQIYRMQTHPDAKLRQWDLFFHAQAAPVAVRNRKAYFQDLIERHLAALPSRATLEVLNVASGPARDVQEFFLRHPHSAVQMDCVDMDAQAITHARRLCAPWLDRLTFHHRNVLRFIPTRGYDLTWSAGLFDYLSDRLFVHVLKSLIGVTKPGGEVVIGNFSDYNPSRDYMELLGDWKLIHRSRETLYALAAEAGAEREQVQIFWEPEGVNNFLHIRR